MKFDSVFKKRLKFDHPVSSATFELCIRMSNSNGNTSNAAIVFDPLYHLDNYYYFTPKNGCKKFNKLMYMLINKSYTDVDIQRYLEDPDHKREVHEFNEADWSPLMIACRNRKDIKLVAFLLDNGADINYHVSGYAALVTAILNSHKDDNIEMVNYLLSKGALVNLPTTQAENNDTTLDIQWNIPFEGGTDGAPPGYTKVSVNDADDEDDAPWYIKIDDEGAESDITALEAAVRSTETNNNNLAIAKLLIDKGAIINPHSKHITTPLIIAANTTQFAKGNDMVELLLANGANVNHQDSFGATALIFAAMNTSNGSDISTVELLLKRGADTELADRDGSTPLLMAVAHCDSTSSLRSVQVLIENNADINRRSASGHSALMLLVGRTPNLTTTAVFDLLLERHTELNYTDVYGDTALLLAIIQYTKDQSTLEIIKKLLLAGADANIADRSNMTPLMHALKSYNKEWSSDLLQLLVEKTDFLSSEANNIIKKYDKERTDTLINESRNSAILKYIRENQELPEDIVTLISEMVPVKSKTWCIIS